MVRPSKFNLSEMVGSQQQHSEQTVTGWPKTFNHMHMCNKLGHQSKTTICVGTWNNEGAWALTQLPFQSFKRVGC